MPRTPLSSAPTDGSVDAATPVVHQTRRARIEAERAAAKGAVVAQDSTGPSFDDVIGAATPGTPAAPVSPIDLAPASPVRPASRIVTPPAPTSPVVHAQPAAPAPSVSQPRRVAGQVPASRRRTSRPAPKAPVDRATRHIRSSTPASAPAPKRGASFRRSASRVTAVGALLFAAGLVVSTSLPAQALWVPESGSTAARASSGATQSMQVGAAADGSTARDQFTVSDATQYANVDSSSFTNDPTGTIQWPFLTGVPITSGFGGRQVAGCSFCSTNHMGVDFAPGEGTPIGVIAAGTVIKVQANDGGFGNDVWVEHDVDGKQFVSVYGHMEDNSFKVVTGQHVEVGDILGLVGSTGNSTGPHLHLEVHVDGVPVDPLAWLKTNAN
ncbi:M23 family metallopeptidase [Curtobacterium flaccumfaciens]|uniref:M23 family metallopeptidase n=1 Tax=Curtobacterium flaccumfaciens TaxID=2035 RepID=UPI000FFEAB75|nr:M23 family metallopeptidase [Curtobacterium flaccumfaciens]MCS0645681.1 peptidoglycan DD-metalloendopeptidase family protein [Curtobacterium flaccumfaciens pv. flaccumfaciens]MCS6525696.1 peptidoglycan DD-metalloendopeptidase family protein [Curtobacterium flaccumfaciens pv. flaccumfaciens]MCS6529278.1 peptidoglycan DD-metalloendopeptidase family protein [Curtobacterium flaccumfaciens pv. flaccumfaciens]NUU10462.1 peptidoglycan DD-metalloendopeptidase family protein [Curtobacterium flaccumfa